MVFYAFPLISLTNPRLPPLPEEINRGKTLQPTKATFGCRWPWSNLTRGVDERHDTIGIFRTTRECCLEKGDQGWYTIVDWCRILDVFVDVFHENYFGWNLYLLLAVYVWSSRGTTHAFVMGQPCQKLPLWSLCDLFLGMVKSIF